jgi:hypothetical protein
VLTFTWHLQQWRNPSWRSRSPPAALRPVQAGDGVALLWGARKCMVHVDGAWETWVVVPPLLAAPAEVLSPQHARYRIQDDHTLQRQACLRRVTTCMLQGLAVREWARGAEPSKPPLWMCSSPPCWLLAALALVCRKSISTMQRVHGGALHIAGSSCDPVQRAPIVSHRLPT